MVERLFLPHEAFVILGIPLNNRLPPDNISWGLTPNGSFSTKSSYKMIVALDNNGVVGSSTLNSQRNFWKNFMELEGVKQGETLCLACLQQCPPHHGQSCSQEY